MLTGFLMPTSGHAEIGGVNVLTNPTAAQRQLGYLPEGAPAYADTSVIGYLTFIAEIRGLSRQAARQAIGYVAERVHLEKVLQQPIGTLSKGFKRRLGLAQALIHNPDVLILDEPTDGLDPNQKHEVRNLIREISSHKAIIISTHILDEVESICDRVLIIDRGSQVIDGTPDEIIQQTEGRPSSLEVAFRELTRDVDDKPNKPVSAPVSQTVSKSSNTTFRDVWIVLKREFLGYFSTPIAYVFMVIFLATIGALTFFLGGFFDQGQASLSSFFQFHPWLYLFLVPAIAMRLWAEERKSGSIEVLLTLPVSTLSIVIGKFAAAWLVIGIGLVLTFPLWITVNYLGSPDNGVIAAGYAGSFLMAGGYLAIGACVSATTSNQVIAFILAAALCLVFTASGLGLVLEFFSGWAPRPMLAAIASLSFLEHFQAISRGVIDARDLVFFVSTLVFFLFANLVIVEHYRNA